MKKLLCVIGTRPQVIKHMPFQKEMEDHYDIINLHTGQHYDHEMKAIFVKDIKLDNELELSSTDRKGRILEMANSISKYIDDTLPDMVIVYGDTDTTLAAAQATTERGLALCHIEAGLRSHNLDMPEEINRIETDKLSHLLLCPSVEAVNQLQREGITEGVFMVGDIMKDAIQMNQNVKGKLRDYNYYYATLHRPYNVDIESRLRYVLGQLSDLDDMVILPLHPRTEGNMKRFGISKSEYNGIEFVAPQSYLSNLNYMLQSRAVLTDSGGMQKEAYWISKKCITLRSETEWKETLHNGCNTLMFADLSDLQSNLKEASGPWNTELYGDGNSAKRIKDIIDQYFNQIK